MAVTVIRDAVNGRSFSAEPGHRMYLYSESGRLAFAVDFAPSEIDYGGMAMNWAEAKRSGDKPLLLHEDMPLRTMSFDFMISDKYDMQQPQTSKIAILRGMGRSFERFLVAFSSSEQGLWRVKDLKVKSEARAEDGDEITRATVSITLAEASDPAPAVGPISKPPPKPPTPPAPVRRTHTVRKGDTLWAIAKRYYNNATLWPRLYDANRKIIRDPHWIYPGQRLIIP